MYLEKTITKGNNVCVNKRYSYGLGHDLRVCCKVVDAILSPSFNFQVIINTPSFLDSISADKSIQYWVHILAHVFNQNAVAVRYCSLNGIQVPDKNNKNRQNMTSSWLWTQDVSESKVPASHQCNSPWHEHVSTWWILKRETNEGEEDNLKETRFVV